MLPDLLKNSCGPFFEKVRTFLKKGPYLSKQCSHQSSSSSSSVPEEEQRNYLASLIQKDERREWQSKRFRYFHD
jgi:hypothetical protein